MFVCNNYQILTTTAGYAILISVSVRVNEIFTLLNTSN